MVGGSHSQNGQYQYAQVEVNNTGSYLAKSVLSTPSSLVTIDMGQAHVTASTPADAQSNEVWVYRKGGLLDAWYRIKVLTSNYDTPFYDTLSDLDALDLNIKFDPSFISVASITDKIFDIIGPVNGRWYYFTTNFMYPSDINDPDLINPGLAIRISGSYSELFMWARQLNDSTILVGTSVDIYTLSGTYATFPDGTIDSYYRPLHCSYPPLTCDAAAWGGAVYYIANDGWRLIDSSGSNPSLVSPNLDRLYRGETIGFYSGINLKVPPRTVRFPIVIAKNKMWLFMHLINGQARIEIYDFIRKYWRTSIYGLSNGDLYAVGAATKTSDGRILAFYNTDSTMREIDVQSSKLIDGEFKQLVSIRSMVFDGQMPRNRKIVATVKVRMMCTDVPVVEILPEGSTILTFNGVGAFGARAVVTDQFADISFNPKLDLVKTYQVYLHGKFADILVEDFSILYDPLPEQRTFVRLLNNNFGTASKKRVRNWPLVIDTLGNDVLLIDTVDNATADIVPHTINTVGKQTVNVFYIADAFGVDYGCYLHSTGLFEFYGRLDPEIVQVLPIAKRFDQVGPEEFFRYGKIKQIEFRIQPRGGTVMPFNIYFNDNSVLADTFEMVDNKEGTYFVMVPKGTSGNIARVELGPTDFDFHRFYTRLLVADSGNDTNLKWVNLP